MYVYLNIYLRNHPSTKLFLEFVHRIAAKENQRLKHPASYKH